jgi:hypothetical protein
VKELAAYLKRAKPREVIDIRLKPRETLRGAIDEITVFARGFRTEGTSMNMSQIQIGGKYTKKALTTRIGDFTESILRDVSHLNGVFILWALTKGSKRSTERLTVRGKVWVYLTIR